MSVGSLKLDGRYSIPDSSTQIASLIGPYLERTWNGANQTAAPPKPYWQPVKLKRWKPASVRFNRRTGAYYTTWEQREFEVIRTIYPPKRKKGLLRSGDPHPYALTRYEWFNPPIYVAQHGIANAVTYLGGYRELFSEPTISNWTSNDDLALLGKLRNAISGESFNAGVFLAESGEALTMIANAAKRITASVRYARKGNWVQAFRQITDSDFRSTNRKASRAHVKNVAANNWLELQYGWLPLMSDAESGAAFLATALNMPLTFKTRATYRRPAILGNTVTSRGRCTFGGNRSTIRGQYIAYLTEVDYPAMAGLKDPASIIWELLPYSFVFDWFAPIGDYLEARTMVGALKGTFVKSTKVLLDVSEPIWRWTDPYWDIVGGDTSLFRISRLQFSRSVSTTLSVPLPSIKNFDKVASWRHCANALSLLAQLKPTRVGL